jgi:hypothetical protein
MKRSRYSEEQVVGILREAAGSIAAEVTASEWAKCLLAPG